MIKAMDYTILRAKYVGGSEASGLYGVESPFKELTRSKAAPIE